MKMTNQPIKLPEIGFYDFVGVIVPGTVLLVGTDFLFNIEELEPLLIPESFGSLGTHLVLAYLIGHLLQAIGNAFERIYWKLWHGMPTDWPVTRPELTRFSQAIDVICQLTGQEKPTGNIDARLKEWRRLVAQARSTIYANGRAARIQVFNGIYGMFRGVLASLIIGALLGWRSTEINMFTLYTALILLGILTGLRMHRFALHYATELFASAGSLAKESKATNAS